jgi:hypothetical protein
MEKSFKWLFTILLVFVATGLYAQHAFTAAGGDASGSGGAVSYSVGQVFYTSQSGGTGISSPGVQHAYEIYTVGIAEYGISLSVTVYPNPSDEYLFLEVSDYLQSKLLYRLYDMNGRLLMAESVGNLKTRIDTGTLLPATYILTVMQENSKNQSFIIIKK